VIRLNIEVDTPQQLLSQIAALAVGMGITANQIAGLSEEKVRSAAEPKIETEEKPAPKPRAKKSDAAPAAATGSDQTSDVGSAETTEGNSEKAATSPAEPSSAAGDFGVEGVDPTNKDSVRAYLSQSIDILTGAVVTQVFGEFGATKFGEVPADKYEAMVVRLDELRKAKEAEAAEAGA
jgi:hypothetical protein